MHTIMSKPKKPAAQSPRPGVQQISAYIRDELADAFERYLRETRPRPTRRSVFEAALEDFLSAKGYWPPQP